MNWKDRVISGLAGYTDTPRSLAYIYGRLKVVTNNAKAKVRQTLQYLRKDGDAFLLEAGVWVIPNRIKHRDKWRSHVIECRKVGRCINCKLSAVPGEDRCSLHKEINRRKINLYTFKRYYARTSKGLCVSCPTYSVKAVTDGKKQCESCLEAKNERQRLARIVGRPRS